MKKIIYFTLLFVISFAVINVHAISCTDEEQERVVASAKKISITYQHTQGIFFDIIITNLEKNMQLYDETNDRYIGGTGEVVTLNYYVGGKAYSFTALPKSGACSDRGAYTFLVKVPSYNTYAETEYCYDHPDFKYCDPWYKGYISLEAFSQAVTEYEASLKEKNDVQLKKSVINGLIDFYKDYKLYILGGFALVIMSVGAIVIYNVKSRRAIKL